MCFCASFTGLNQARLQGNIVPNHFSIFMLGEEDHIFGNPFFAVRMIIFKDLALSPFYINNDNSLFLYMPILFKTSLGKGGSPS